MAVTEIANDSTEVVDGGGATRRGWFRNATIATLVVAVGVLGWLAVEARKRMSDVEARAKTLERRTTVFERHVESFDTRTIARRVDDLEQSVSSLEGTSFGLVSISDVNTEVDDLRTCVNNALSDLEFQSGGYVYLSQCLG